MAPGDVLSPGAFFLSSGETPVPTAGGAVATSSTRGHTCRYVDTGQRSVSADRVSEFWYRRRRDRGALEEPDHVDRDRGATGSGRLKADIGGKP